MSTGPGIKPFLILYSQMAATILFDMGLTRTPNEEQQSCQYLRVWSIRPPPPPKIRTMEERRAVLALWFCTSVCTSFIGKMETLGWTSHMDDCLAVLEREGEQPLDEVLVALVKIQLIGEEAHKLLRREATGETGQGPTYIFKAGLQSRLNEIQQRLPARLRSHHVVKSQMYSVEAQVHSISLFADQAIPETMRISGKYACTKAARAWFDTFFAVPLVEVPGLPFAVYVSMSHMQAVLYRLTTSEDPAWDKEILRNTADLLALLDQTIDKFGKVGDVYSLKTDDSEGTIFSKGARILRNVRNSWEPALSQYLGGSLPTPSSQAMSCSAMEPRLMVENPLANDTPSLDLNDMAWMTDIFGPWEF
ncbi:Uncharacterized protein TPAR_05276 [Tolypocladium paradoxum]|uniref:Uncharacterized protein n=1 Tax=Tolypocladium paradoxum TaxID=94208 RepID=A0A2S4KWI4_9HYPO|nr:Uncharacterized protein TPAR_05276 [Tolypocladium paradoxum]